MPKVFSINNVKLFLNTYKFLKKLYKFAFNGEEVTPFLDLACQFFSNKNRISMEKKETISLTCRGCFIVPQT
jgi:hypothetical protein